MSPLLLMHGAATHADSEAMVPAVSVVGVEESFGGLYEGAEGLRGVAGRAVALNETLARALGAKPGDAILLNVDRPSAVAADSLFAHHKREETLRTLRLEVTAVLPDSGAGGFRLDAGVMPARNLFIEREWLAGQVDQPGGANTLAVAWQAGRGRGELVDRAGTTTSLLVADSGRPEDALRAALAAALQPEDHGLTLRGDPERGYLSIESKGVVLREAQVAAVQAAASEAAGRAGAGRGVTATLVSTNLATSIRRPGGRGPDLAYAIIAGLGGSGFTFTAGDAMPLAGLDSAVIVGAADPGFTFAAGGGKPLDHEGLWLNEWAAQDLGARLGERFEVGTLVPSWNGVYKTVTRTLVLRGIVKMQGPGADPGLVPALPGITDAERVDAWEAPFPLDMSRVTPRDDEYWERYRAAPKAFVSPETARDIWLAGAPPGMADWITSVRLTTPGPGGVDALRAEMSQALRRHLTPEAGGFQVRPVRRLAVAASSGTTDFGQLFLAMSFFLVLSAAGLAGMTMRLLAERRASETGVLLACGFGEGAAVRAVWGEGAILTAVGALLGCPLGILYAWAILGLLTTRWVGAVTTSALWLHVTPVGLVAGLLSGLGVGLLSVWWGARALRGRPVLELLAGWRAMGVLSEGSPRWVRALFWGMGALAGVLVVASIAAKALSPQAAFFGSGAALLAAALAGCRLLLARALSVRGRVPSLPHLALRGAAANRGRSMLAVGLLASASFLVVAVAANKRDISPAVAGQRDSGAGGFALQVTTALPARYDFGSPEGRAELGFPPEEEALFQGVEVVPFLMSPGEDVSCLNIARPSAPRILGVTRRMVERGGFTVNTLDRGAPKPWEALQAPAADGAVPAFGDADSVLWSLHSGLGKVYPIPEGAGGLKAVRFVGVLPGSVFAGELLVSEESFRAAFPGVSAPRYFLVDVPAGKEEQVAQSLRRNLADLGADVRTTHEILNAFHQVVNTYLSTFLALGGLGILLGTFGLVSVLLRSALERRSEFALMLATGFQARDLARLLVIENAGLLLAGLACGVVSALVAVAPQLVSVEARVPWGSLLLVLSGMFALGLVSCAAAARLAVRGDLVRALREE